MSFSATKLIPDDLSESPSPPKANAKKETRSKNPKTTHQIVFLKYFYHIMEKSEKKREVVEHIQRHTGFTQRQVYKWMWDETLRIRQRTKSQNDHFKEKNTEAFGKMLDVFEETFRDTKTFVLDTMTLPRVGELTDQNSQFVWKAKLKEIFGSTIMLQQKR